MRDDDDRITDVLKEAVALTVHALNHGTGRIRLNHADGRYWMVTVSERPEVTQGDWREDAERAREAMDARRRSVRP